MMKDELQMELDRSKSFVLRYSAVFLLAIIILMILGLALLHIQGRSILVMAKDYFIR
jgi:hypothetical protein